MRKIPFSKKLATLGYMLGGVCLTVALLLGISPASISYAQSGSGAIWTTTSACGDPQDVNHYQVGEAVYINGANFESNEGFDWDITRVSGNPKMLIIGGNSVADLNGSFCFAAYTIQPGDGEATYQATVGEVKSDNFRVDSSDPTPTSTDVPPTLTPVPATFTPAAGLTCPLTLAGVGSVVQISNAAFIRSDQTEAKAKIGPIKVDIAAGSYKITLTSYDQHSIKPDETQTMESWFLIFLDSAGAEIVRSGAIGDLPNELDWLFEVTDTDLQVSSDVASVIAYHAAYPFTGPNSIVPVCVRFEAVQTEPTATNTAVPLTHTPTSTALPPTETPTSTLLPPTETPANRVTSTPTEILSTETSVPPTDTPQSSFDPNPSSTPTGAPATSVPPPGGGGGAGVGDLLLIPVTGFDFAGELFLSQKLFIHSGVILLGFGFLMHGFWLRSKREG